jgi:hypothetical protein
VLCVLSLFSWLCLFFSVVESRWKQERAARRAAAPTLLRDASLVEQMQRVAIEVYKDAVPDEGSKRTRLTRALILFVVCCIFNVFLRATCSCATIFIRLTNYTVGLGWAVGFVGFVEEEAEVPPVVEEEEGEDDPGPKIAFVEPEPEQDIGPERWIQDPLRWHPALGIKVLNAVPQSMGARVGIDGNIEILQVPN